MAEEAPLKAVSQLNHLRHASWLVNAEFHEVCTDSRTTTVNITS